EARAIATLRGEISRAMACKPGCARAAAMVASPVPHPKSRTRTVASADTNCRVRLASSCAASGRVLKPCVVTRTSIRGAIRGLLAGLQLSDHILWTDEYEPPIIRQPFQHLPIGGEHQCIAGKACFAMGKKTDQPPGARDDFSGMAPQPPDLVCS